MTGRQVGAIEIFKAGGFSVVSAEDADLGAVCRGELGEGLVDEGALLVPAEAVCEVLGEWSVAERPGGDPEMGDAGIGDPLRGCHEGIAQGEDQKAECQDGGLENREGDQARLPQGRDAGLPEEAAGGEEDGVDGGGVVVLGVEGGHGGEEENIGESEPALGGAAEEPVKPGEPDKGADGAKT